MTIVELFGLSALLPEGIFIPSVAIISNENAGEYVLTPILPSTKISPADLKLPIKSNSYTGSVLPMPT